MRECSPLAIIQIWQKRGLLGINHFLSIMSVFSIANKRHLYTGKANQKQVKIAHHELMNEMMFLNIAQAYGEVLALKAL